MRFFNTVVKHTSIRVMQSLVANFDQEIDQMDVRTSFLYGNLKEIIYMEQP